MDTKLTDPALGTVLDVSGLPDPVVRSLKQLVDSLRATPTTGTSQSTRPRLPVVGRYAHLGASIPKEDMDKAQREAWSSFPREVRG
jgi:hypothetical protein